MYFSLALLKAQVLDNTFMYQPCTPVYQWLEAATIGSRQPWNGANIDSVSTPPPWRVDHFSLPCGIPGKVVSQKLGYTFNLWGHSDVAQVGLSIKLVS